MNEKKIRDIGGQVYYASVREEDGMILTSSSRAIAVLGVANTITEAETVVEESMKHIQGDLFYRKDIGTRPLVEKRIEHMKELSEANQRMEVLVANTTEREKRMIKLKQEINGLLVNSGKEIKYHAPKNVEEMLNFKG